MRIDPVEIWRVKLKSESSQKEEQERILRMSDAGYDPSCLPDLLPIYYKKLFPYGPYFRWLNYGGGTVK